MDDSRLPSSPRGYAYPSSRRRFLQAIAAGLASTAGTIGQTRQPDLPSTELPTGGLFRKSALLYRFPYVQDVRRTRATIRWTTKQPGDGIVEFWSDANEKSNIAASMKAFHPAETGMNSPYYRYEAVLTKLDPGTDYRYRVLMNGSPVVAEISTFRTPGTQPFDFLVLGDSGTGSAEQRQIANRMMQHRAQFIVHTGDLVYPTGTYERYETLYFQYYQELMRSTPFFPCPGNHDYYETSCIPYRAVNSFPIESVQESDHGRYYSFDWGNAHFISLDSNDALFEAVSGSGAMLSWIENDLQETRKFWRIVIVHHPVYSVGKHADGWEPRLLREYLAPILDKYSVPLVLNGHEHSYQRSAPIRGGEVSEAGKATVYITSGGGGAPLHPVFSGDFMEVAIPIHHYLSCSVNGAKLEIKALLPDGAELDSTVIAPLPTLASQPVINAASFTPQLASGGLISIFGLHLSPDNVIPLKYPLPKNASGTSVLLNDRALPILMASAQQLNVQLPFNTVGDLTLRVRTPNGIAECPVSVVAVAPALFSEAIFHADGVQVSKDFPAQVGELITLFLTGLGDVQGSAIAGEAAEGQPVAAKVRLRVGGQTIEPEFAGLTDGLAGVNQVIFRVPPLLTKDNPSQSPGNPDDGVLISVLADGIESNSTIFYGSY